MENEKEKTRCQKILLTEMEDKKMEVIDRKFKFIAFNPCKGTIYTEKNAVLFLAKDAGLLPTLDRYLKFCENSGCDSNHIESIELLMGRVRRFQQEWGDKLPDTNTPCEIARCIKGKLED